jgi:hypothetical protein
MNPYKSLFTEDLIPGGKADDVKTIEALTSSGDSVFTVDIEQIKKGLKVESEHTSDPAVALEIVFDHLTEFDDYYDRLEKAEEA